MNEAEIQRQKEIKEAEELLFTGPQALGFAKGLFLGRFVADWAMPYPRVPAAQQEELDKSLAEVREFLDQNLDPVAIDRTADIPRQLIDGLARVGVLGMTAPKEYGGRGFSQRAYCEDPRGNRRALRFDFRFHKRAPFDWHSRLASFRHARAEAEMAAAAGLGSATGGLRADGKRSGLGCRERPDAGASRARTAPTTF